MATHTLTSTKLINWISASTQSTLVVGATPSSESLALLTQCLNAAITQVTAYYTLPDTYTDDVELAILMHAADLWQARLTPNGIAAIGEFGAVRVPSSFNGTVLGLLSQYKTGWFNTE